jgi:hypothetical protein
MIYRSKEELMSIIKGKRILAEYKYKISNISGFPNISGFSDPLLLIQSSFITAAQVVK